MSRACDGKRSIAAIDDLFADGIGRWRYRRLVSHLEACAPCRAYYDRVATLWEAMGPEAMPSMIAEERARSLARALERATSPRWSRALAGVATTLGLAAVALVLVVWVRRPHMDLVERGGTSTATRLRGVRAFCVENDRVSGSIPALRTVGEASPYGELLRCRVSGSLQFAYSLGAAGAPESLYLVGRDSDGKTHEYAHAEPLTAGATELPLSSSVRLAVKHRAGVVRVDVLFTTGMLHETVLARALAGEAVPGVVDHQRLTLMLYE